MRERLQLFAGVLFRITSKAKSKKLKMAAYNGSKLWPQTDMKRL
jgi:hypothetical protein